MPKPTNPTVADPAAAQIAEQAQAATGDAPAAAAVADTTDTAQDAVQSSAQSDSDLALQALKDSINGWNAARESDLEIIAELGGRLEAVEGKMGASPRVRLGDTVIVRDRYHHDAPAIIVAIHKGDVIDATVLLASGSHQAHKLVRVEADSRTGGWFPRSELP